DAVTVSRSCDARLAGQAHQISVSGPLGTLTAVSADEVRRAFDRTYLGLFMRAAPGVPVEALNWRLHVSGPPPAMSPFRSAGTRDARAAIKGQRPIYLAERGDFATVPVYDRYLLGNGAQFEGPAVVEERESTIVVGPGGRARVDEWSNVIIDLEGTDWPG
ncbi:MAG: hydantoinase/oxoprolinase family protein, partial [Chloroflexota bacterium]